MANPPDKNTPNPGSGKRLPGLPENRTSAKPDVKPSPALQRSASGSPSAVPGTTPTTPPPVPKSAASQTAPGKPLSTQAAGSKLATTGSATPNTTPPPVPKNAAGTGAVAGTKAGRPVEPSRPTGPSRPDAPRRPAGPKPASGPSRPTASDGPSRPSQPARPRSGPARPPARRGAAPAPRGKYIERPRPAPARPPRPAGRPATRGRYAPAKVYAEPKDDSAWIPLLLGLLLLGGIAWYAIKHYTPIINSDLTTRTNSALADAGYGEGTSVEIDGAVDNQLTVGNAADSLADEMRVQPSIAITAADGKFALSGVVSDQAYATRIEDGVKENFGAENVTGAIEVDQNSTNPGWWLGVAQLLPDMQPVNNNALSVSDGTLTLMGEAPDEETKSGINTRAQELLQGQLTIDDQITVAASAPAAPLLPGTATIFNAPNRITILGTLPASSAATLEEALTTNDKPVESFVKIDEEKAEAEWVTQITESFTALQQLEKGKIKVLTDGGVQISGIAASDADKQTAYDVVASRFDNIEDKISVIEPEPVAFMSAFATLSGTDSVNITGLLPESALTSLVDSLKSQGKEVETNVSVDARVIEPDWPVAATGTLSALADLNDPSVTVSSAGEVTVRGEADDEDEMMSALSMSEAAFGASVTVLNEITVKEQDTRSLFDGIDLAGIRFRSNSSELNPDSVEILEQVANALLQAPSVNVAITGHTDSLGNADRNLTLSATRAEQVRTFLISRSIGADRLTSRGIGSSEPIASNDNAAGRALNRRIEFVLTNGE